VSESEFTCGFGISSIFTVGIFPFPSIVQVSITNSVQKAINGYLAYEGATTFYASEYPGFEQQEPVYTSSDTVQVSFRWQAK